MGVDAILEGSVRGNPDIDGLAAASDRKTQILVWHYHDDIAAAPAATVQLNVKTPGRGSRVEITHWRIDETHSNPHSVWLAMGSPKKPTDPQLKKLHDAAALQQLEPPCTKGIAPGKPLTIAFKLPRHGVSLVEIAWLE